MLFVCAPGISWSVEIYGIRIIDAGGGASCFLEYPEAALWDFMTRGYDFDRVRRLVGLIGGMDPKGIEGLAAKTLVRWIARGFLVQTDSHG
jgi:hypothetical protein